MTKVRIKRKFPDSTDAKLKEFCDGIIAGLTDNPYFPDGEEQLKPVKIKYEQYVASIPAPNDRSKALITTKTVYKNELIEALMLLLLYVEYKAGYNIEVLQSSNFELTNKRQPKGMVGEVRGIEFKTNGEEGMLLVQCKNDPNATVYKVRVSVDDVNWDKFGANNTRTVKIHDLPVGQKLFVQMRVENSIGKSAWSPSMTAEIPKNNVVLNKVEA